jgi:hypothetical protein
METAMSDDADLDDIRVVAGGALALLLLLIAAAAIIWGVAT